MAEPITEEQTAAVKELWHTSLSVRDAARRVGISKSLVAEIWERQALDKVLGIEREKIAKVPRPKFEKVEAYKCATCEKFLYIKPCVACTAREFRAARGKPG